MSLIILVFLECIGVYADFKQAETKMGDFLSSIDLKINEREYKKYYDMVMEDLAMHSAI